MANIKICNKCKLEKDLLFFNKDVRRKDKLSLTCKECIKKIYLKNKDKIIKYQKDNSDYIKIVKEKYWKNNKIILNSKQQERYYKFKDKLNKISRAYYKNNKQNLLEYQVEYRKNNKEKVREAQRKNYQLRKNNPIYKMRVHCSRTIAVALKKQGASKKGFSILKYLIYTMQELKVHLENLFEPWMNWDNQGRYDKNTWDDKDTSTWKWQIDHIIPHSTFKYSSMEDEEFHKCWALSNLRPLSAKQNFLDGVQRIRHS